MSLRVALELHHTERTPNWLDGAGVFSVSTVLPPRPKVDDERQFYTSFLNKWVAGLKRQGLKFRLDHVANSQLMAQALEAGDRLLLERDLLAADGRAEGGRALHPGRSCGVSWAWSTRSRAASDPT